MPAFNEATQIQRCIRQVCTHVTQFCSSFEIVVSEDGSTDGTDKIVAELAKTDPTIVLLHSPNRLGKGKAIKNAVDAAKGRVVAFMDVDLATDLDCLPKLYNVISEKGGMAIGSRHVKGAVVQRSATRTLFSLTFNLFVRILFLDGVRDHQCGFKTMSRSVAKAVLDKSKSDGYFFDTEMIVLCKKLGYPVTEVPVVWTEKNKGSKVNPYCDSTKILRDMLRFRFSQ